MAVLLILHSLMIRLAQGTVTRADPVDVRVVVFFGRTVQGGS
jgi:hypothetical protein